MQAKRVYIDNAAATRLDERVLETMKPYFFDKYAVATSEFARPCSLELIMTFSSAAPLRISVE